jgi:hypothetical protein
VRDEEIAALRPHLKETLLFEKSVQLTNDLVLNDKFAEFLTLPAYDILITVGGKHPKMRAKI